MSLVGTFNKEKALVGSISGHCEHSRGPVDSCTVGEPRGDRGGHARLQLQLGGAGAAGRAAAGARRGGPLRGGLETWGQVRASNKDREDFAIME